MGQPALTGGCGSSGRAAKALGEGGHAEGQVRPHSGGGGHLGLSSGQGGGPDSKLLSSGCPELGPAQLGTQTQCSSIPLKKLGHNGLHWLTPAEELGCLETAHLLTEWVAKFTAETELNAQGKIPFKLLVHAATHRPVHRLQQRCVMRWALISYLCPEQPPRPRSR